MTEEQTAPAPDDEPPLSVETDEPEPKDDKDDE
jgi:hypothetical protein